MNRLLLIFAALFGSTIALAQNAPPTIKSTEVAPGVYMLTGAVGNITLLIGDEHIVLIDDGVGPVAAQMIDKAAEIAGRPVDFLINTHLHGDHVGANAAFAETGAVIVAHDNVHKRLLIDPSPAGGPAGLPVMTFSDAVTFHLNNRDAFVFHVAAAHTDGDAVIQFRDINVIHAADVFFNYLFPFIDLDNGGSVAGFLAAQRRLVALADADTIIIPGHGPLANVTDLQIAIDMLIDAEARIKALVIEGKTEEEILAENPLSVYHDQWNWHFITTERMTRTLYRSLTSN